MHIFIRTFSNGINTFLVEFIMNEAIRLSRAMNIVALTSNGFKTRLSMILVRKITLKVEKHFLTLEKRISVL